MKHKKGINICCLLLLILCKTAYADPAAYSVQDATLDKCIKALMNKKQWQTAADVESIKCHKSNIKSTQGIEKFVNLKHLSLFGNAIKAIDINGLHKLETLNVAGNKIEQLTLSSLPRLEKVFVFKNQLTTLQMENLPLVSQIKANNNTLTSVKLAETPKLVKLYLFNNKLETLDIEQLPSLDYLDVRQNPMPDSFYDFLDKQDHLTSRHDGNMDDWD